MYLQNEQFAEVIKEKNLKLKNLQNEIISLENRFVSQNSKTNLKSKIDKKKKKIIKEINMNCEKAIQIIKHRQNDLHRQCEFHFNQLFDKFIFFTSECKSSLEINDEWKEIIKNNDLNQVSDSIKHKFEFLNKIDNLNLISTGENILEGIQEIQNLINERIEDGLNTFIVHVNNFDEFFLDTEQKEFDYDYDLKETLRNIIDSKYLNQKISDQYMSIENLESPQENLLSDSQSARFGNSDFEFQDHIYINDSQNEIDRSYDIGQIENVYSKQTSLDGQIQEYSDNYNHHLYNSGYYNDPEDEFINESYSKTNDNFYPRINELKISTSQKKSFVNILKQKNSRNPSKNKYLKKNPSVSVQDNNIRLGNKNNLSKLLNKGNRKSKFKKELLGLHSHLKSKLSADVYQTSRNQRMSYQERELSSNHDSYNNLETNQHSKNLNHYSSVYDNRIFESNKKSNMNEKYHLKSTKLTDRWNQIKIEIE